MLANRGQVTGQHVPAVACRLSNARNPKEAGAPLGCSLLHLRSCDPQIRCSASGAVAVNRDPLPSRRTVGRGRCGGAFTPVALQRLLQVDPLPDPDRLLPRPASSCPSASASGCPSAINIHWHPRTPHASQNAPWFSRTTSSFREQQATGHGSAPAGCRLLPVACHARETPRKLDRGLALSGFAPKRRNAAPVRDSAVSRFLPVVPTSPSAEASVDLRHHLWAGALG